MPRSLLHHENVELALKPDGMVGVVTRGTVVQAITHHDFPGAPSWRRQPISAPVREAVLSAAKAVGLKPRKARDMVGAYELGAVLDQGPGYQDREARHSTLDGMRRRARVYLVPEQTSVERHQQLKRAADRGVGMLMDVRGGPYILPCHEYVPDAARRGLAGQRALAALAREREGRDAPLQLSARLGRAHPGHRPLFAARGGVVGRAPGARAARRPVTALFCLGRLWPGRDRLPALDRRAAWQDAAGGRCPAASPSVPRSARERAHDRGWPRRRPRARDRAGAGQPRRRRARVVFAARAGAQRARAAARRRALAARGGARRHLAGGAAGAAGARPRRLVARARGSSRARRPRVRAEGEPE